MGPSNSTAAEISVQVNDDIRLVIEEGYSETCFTNVYYQDEHLGRLNPFTKPWEDLSLTMTSQVIIAKSGKYDSREELNELQYEAMLKQKTELDNVFGWPDDE